jgi:hypothetical protein
MSYLDPLETGPDGKPLHGTPPARNVGRVPKFAGVAEESAEVREVARKGYEVGGKAAASRRLVLRSSDARSVPVVLDLRRFSL